MPSHTESQLNNQADTRAAEIREAYQTHGAGAALSLLHQELEADQAAFLKANGGNAQDFFKEFTTYYARLEQDLMKDNVLPALSIAWTQADGSNGKTLLSGDKLTRTAIDKQEKVDLEHQWGAFDHLLLDGLDKSLKKDSVTTADLKVAGEAIYESLTDGNSRKRVAQEDLRALAIRLVQPTNGGESLFHALDVAGGDPSEKGDGRIDKDDIEDFINKYKSREGVGAYTPENLALAQALLASWDDPQGPYWRVLQSGRNAKFDANGIVEDTDDDFEVASIIAFLGGKKEDGTDATLRRFLGV